MSAPESHLTVPPGRSGLFRGARLAPAGAAVASGLLLFAAFPPIGLWPVAWLAPAPLLVQLYRARRARSAILLGWLFGVAFLGPTWYWTGLTIVGWTGSAIGWVAWAALTLVGACFYAAFAGVANWLGRVTTGGWRVLATTCAWVLTEYVRTLGHASMPWAQLSTSQYRAPAVIQIADLTGSYGISFMVFAVSAGVAERLARDVPARSGRWVWLTATLTGMSVLYGFGRLVRDEPGRPIRVAAIQAIEPLFERPGDRVTETRTMRALAARAANARPAPSLLVFGETAAPGDAVNSFTTREFLTDMATESHAAILCGTRVDEDDSGREWNSSVLYVPRTGLAGRYDKRQLVPFGEYIPCRSLFPAALARSFQFFETDLTRGVGPPLVRIPFGSDAVAPAGVFICYESLYPGYARTAVADGAQLLVTQSNDAWFHSTAAMEQHLAAVVLRAVETRRWIVRATNTGITCVVRPDGRIAARLPVNDPAVLQATAGLMTGKTPYVILGDWFVAVCFLLLLVAAYVHRGPASRNRDA